MSEPPSSPTALFVYGTLQPGEPRWRYLQPYVVGDGVAETVAGRLYDTGLGYPAALFARQGVDAPRDTTIDPTVVDAPGMGSPGMDGSMVNGLILGRSYQLRSELLAEAWAELDAVEAAVIGTYQRVPIITTAGRPVQAYEFGLDAAECAIAGVALTPIESGNWAEWCASLSG